MIDRREFFESVLGGSSVCLFNKAAGEIVQIRTPTEPPPPKWTCSINGIDLTKACIKADVSSTIEAGKLTPLGFQPPRQYYVIELMFKDLLPPQIRDSVTSGEWMRVELSRCGTPFFNLAMWALKLDYSCGGGAWSVLRLRGKDVEKEDYEP